MFKSKLDKFRYVLTRYPQRRTREDSPCSGVLRSMGDGHSDLRAALERRRAPSRPKREPRNSPGRSRRSSAKRGRLGAVKKPLRLNMAGRGA